MGCTSLNIRLYVCNGFRQISVIYSLLDRTLNGGRIATNIRAMSFEPVQTCPMVLIPLTTCSCVTDAILPNDTGDKVKIAYVTSLEAASRLADWLPLAG